MSNEDLSEDEVYDDEFMYDESASEYEMDNEGEFVADDSLTHRELLQYKQHTTQELVKDMERQCTELAEVFGRPKDDVITLLQTYRWNNERLMEDYMDDPKGVAIKAGLSSTGNTSGLELHAESDTCMICCEEKTRFYKLHCGHEFCLDCYRRYLDDKVKQANVIKCPSCDVAMTPADIDAVMGRKGSSVLLQNSIREYVERRKTYKWCPSPDCDSIVEVINASEIPQLVAEKKIPMVTCTKGHQFCFSCGFESHNPCPCGITKEWIAKCKDDSETVKWIVSHTKCCPKCETTIEKNGGCNHMTCRKCSFQFCWICLGNWMQHNNQYYQCNRFQELPADKQRDVSNSRNVKQLVQRSLQRYLHYYSFFNIHEQSTKQDAKRCNVVEHMVRSLQEEVGISWIEAQFLVECATKLLTARRVLKWSYAFAFYCDNSVYLDLFESVQAGLADAVEALSLLFEIEDPKKIVRKRLDFLNAGRLLVDRQKAMTMCTEDAITNGTLSKNATLRS